MTEPLEFTGERFVPGTPGAIAYEHGHRYAFARRYADGKRVLDAACGEGYGAAQLAQVAASVCGVDISEQAIAHAREAYRDVRNLRFESASVAALPLEDASIDVVASFETIEHLPADEQPKMLAEFARVLAPDGLLVISSPNRRRYTDERDYHNPFHLHELDREDLESLLDPYFVARRWFHQVPIMASAIWGERDVTGLEAWLGDGTSVEPASVRDGLYYVVVAARNDGALPRCAPMLSLFHDRDESELARAEAAHGEVLRLDGLLRTRDDALARQQASVTHLEGLVAYRERIVEERDAQLTALNDRCARHEQEIAALRAGADALQQRVGALSASLAQEQQRGRDEAERVREAHDEIRRIEAALAAQERLIHYRQSLRWWLQLPWVRAHSWWRQVVRS